MSFSIVGSLGSVSERIVLLKMNVETPNIVPGTVKAVFQKFITRKRVFVKTVGILNNIIIHHLVHIVKNNFTQTHNNHILVFSNIIMNFHQNITIFFNL